MAMRRPLVEAQTAQARAGANKTAAETELLSRKRAALAKVESSFGQAYSDFLAGQTDTPAMRVVNDALFDLNEGDSTKATESLGDMLKYAKAATGDVRGAGAFDNPASIANQGTRSAEPVPLRNDTVLVDPKSGGVIAQGFQSLNANESLFAPGTTDMSVSATPVATGVRPQAPSGSNPYVDAVKVWNRKIADFIAENGLPDDTSKPAVVAKFTDLRMGLENAKRDMRKFAAPSTENPPLTPPPASGQGGNTPAARKPQDLETAKALLVEAESSPILY